MKTALWKAALLTLSVVLFCVGATSITAFWSGETPGLMAISLSLGFPLVMIFPFSAFIFLRYDKLKEAYAQLEKSHVELQARARIDHMTGLLNREALFETMKISRSRIETGTLLVIDADHFKAINDSFGHGVGDRALKLIAFALQNVTRKGIWSGASVGKNSAYSCPVQAVRRAFVLPSASARRWKIRRSIRPNIRSIHSPSQLGWLPHPKAKPIRRC